MVPALPPLLRIPREPRDIIYDYVALEEETYHADEHAPPREKIPYRLVVHAAGRRPIIRIASPAGLDRTCIKLRREYSDTVEQLATAPYQSSPSSIWTGTCNAISVSVYNCDFEGLIAYLRSLTPQRLVSFANERKLRIRIAFTSLESTKRAGMLAWLNACTQLRVRAVYTTRCCSPPGKPNINKEFYVNIYDLFSKKHASGESEEEKLFVVLRRWYAMRSVRDLLRHVEEFGRWDLSRLKKRRSTYFVPRRRRKTTCDLLELQIRRRSSAIEPVEQC